MGKNTQ